MRTWPGCRPRTRSAAPRQLQTGAGRSARRASWRRRRPSARARTRRPAPRCTGFDRVLVPEVVRALDRVVRVLLGVVLGGVSECGVDASSAAPEWLRTGGSWRSSRRRRPRRRPRSPRACPPARPRRRPRRFAATEGRYLIACSNSLSGVQRRRTKTARALVTAVIGSVKRARLHGTRRPTNGTSTPRGRGRDLIGGTTGTSPSSADGRSVRFASCARLRAP